MGDEVTIIYYPLLAPEDLMIYDMIYDLTDYFSFKNDVAYLWCKYVFTVNGYIFFFFWGIYYHEHKILCAYCLSDTAKLYPHLLMGVNYNYFSTAQLTMEM